LIGFGVTVKVIASPRNQISVSRREIGSRQKPWAVFLSLLTALVRKVRHTQGSKRHFSRFFVSQGFVPCGVTEITAV
jgi:hypothetical protein